MLREKVTMQDDPNLAGFVVDRPCLQVHVGHQFVGKAIEVFHLAEHLPGVIR